MKNYKLIADNFKLEIELKTYEEDLEIPTNSILNVRIDSDNFTALTTMDIDINSFKTFASELLNIYHSLDGSVILKENYGDNYIEFNANHCGHIFVKGVINNLCRNGHTQELKFENEFDQTYLKEFVEKISNINDN